MASERDIRNQIRYGIQQGIQQGMEQGRIQGHKEGHKEGLEEGIERGKVETAIRLKAAGITLEIIAECTGLSLETVKAL